MERTLAQQNKPMRESGAEILRILSIFMVIILHYVKRDYIDEGTMEYTLATVILYFSKIAVNCFVLLSAYFSINVKVIKVRKIFDILIEIAFFGLAHYICLMLFDDVQFKITDLIIYMCPMIKGTLWYIRIYLVLLVLSPFLNILIHNLSKKAYTVLLIVLMAIFSIWPSFLPNPIDELCGLSIINFVLLYIIAGYLRLHWNYKINKYWYLLGYVVFSCLTYITYRTQFVATYENYDFTFTIIASAMLLMFFVNVKIKSKAINYVASTTLGIYVIHEYFKVFVDYTDFSTASEYILKYIVLIPIAVFIVSFVCVVLKKLIFIWVNKIIDKISILNYNIKIYSKSEQLE